MDEIHGIRGSSSSSSWFFIENLTISKIRASFVYLSEAALPFTDSAFPTPDKHDDLRHVKPGKLNKQAGEFWKCR